MKPHNFLFVTVSLFAAAFFIFSCSDKDNSSAELDSKSGSKQESNVKKGEEEEILSYTSEEVGFGIYFDKEATKRTITLEDDQKEFKGYLIIKYPEEISINAVQWRLSLPEGIELVSDDYYRERTLTLGRIKEGISEGFPCVSGPSLLLHTFTFRVNNSLKNAVISILPDKKGDFLGVVDCDANIEIRAASYKAVVNP